MNGLLDNPLLHLGIGLLSQKGRPEGLLSGIQSYSQIAKAQQDAEMKKAQFDAMQRQQEQAVMQQQAQQEAQRRIAESMAMGQGGGIDQQKLSMLNDLSVAQPDIFGQMAQQQFLPQSPEQTDLARKLQEAGYQPGTPEFQQAMQRYLFKPVGTTVNVNTGDIPLTSQQTSKVQEKVRSGIASIEGLKSLADSYSDEYLTYAGKGKKFLLNLADKAGIPIDEESKKYIEGFTSFITQAEQTFNAYRHEITGAAAAFSELQYLKKSFLSGDMGPTEFKAAFNSWANRVQNSLKTDTEFLTSGIPSEQTGKAPSLESAPLADGWSIKRK